MTADSVGNSGTRAVTNTGLKPDDTSVADDKCFVESVKSQLKNCQ